MTMKTFVSQVQIFSGKNAWTYVLIPDDLIQVNVSTTSWGFIPANITINNTTWKSSLMPLGNGSYFIALKASVRKSENIVVGDTIKVSFDIL